jgi:hypothetical protein
LGGFVILGLPDGMWGTAWPAMRTTFHQPLSSLGLILLCATAGGLVTSLGTGASIRHFGVGRQLAAAGLLAAVGGTLLATAAVWAIVLVGALLIGAAAGLLDTGLKRDEVLALHPADVYLDPERPTRGYLAVRATDQARRLRARTLALTPRLAEELARQIAAGGGERIFAMSVRAVNFIVETCAEGAGLRKRGTVSPQMLRDTYALQEVRRRVEIENERRRAGATDADLAALMQRHDTQVCDLLGLTPGETNNPITRYRLLCPLG